MNFRIFVSRQNSSLSNIEIDDGDWTYYPNEHEVLLFPFFAYQFLKTKVKDGVTEVTLIKLPFQNLL